jgi:signal transduction histidine kinase
MSPGAAALIRRSGRVTVGLTIGGASAFLELAFVLVSGLVLVVPSGRAKVFTLARVLARMEQRRLARYLDAAQQDDYSDRRAWQYLSIRWLVGGLGAGILLFIVSGSIGAALILWQLASGRAPGGDEPASWYDPVTYGLVGVLLAFVFVQGVIGVAALDRGLAAGILRPDGQELLRRRVSELATSRAEVVEAVTEERRRIERDLHDGVQQRLVALGILLGRARRATDQQHADELLRQAHDESRQALVELREVTWRVYPIALDEAGLHAALESLAERSSIPVRLHYSLGERIPLPVETVAYFVASEALTNAVKHSGASLVTIDVRRDARTAIVSIVDDGSGGATMSGGGLTGLARRVAAADGAFTVDSPVGGPTVVTAELPCG